LTEPSFKAGYARNSSESANPNLWDGLVGAWMPSLGVTGDTLRDVSGNGNHGTLTNMDAASDWVATSKGLALDYDLSSNQYVSAPDRSIYKSGNYFTASLWVYPEYFHQKHSVLFQYGANVTIPDTNYTFRLKFRGDPSGIGEVLSSGDGDYDIRFGVGVTNGVNQQGRVIIAFGNLNDYLNQWNHFVGVCNGSTIELFWNGEKRASYNSVGSVNYNHTGNVVTGYLPGNVHNNGDNFDGKSSNYMLYNRALSSSEIKQLYVDSLAPFRQKSIRIFRGADIPTATSKLISVKRNNQVDPSFKAGYAQSPRESAHPNLWDGLVGAWMPSLGVTGFVKVRNLVKGRTGDGVITNGMEFTQKGFVQNDADELIQLNDGYVNKSGTVVGSIKPTTQYSYWRSSELWQSRNWGLSINSQTGISTSKWDNSSGFKNVTIPLPKGNVKYHLASSFSDNGELALYVDGIKAGSTPYVTSQTQRGWPVRLASYTDRVAGHHNWTGPYLFGDVLLFDRVLTEKEIQTLYVDSLAPFRNKQQIAFNAYPLTLLEKIRSAAKPTTPVSVRVKHNEEPSYKAGYAKSAGESENPHLWDGLVSWVPSLGSSGSTVRCIQDKSRGIKNDGVTFSGSTEQSLNNGSCLSFDGSDDYMRIYDTSLKNVGYANPDECLAVRFRRKSLTGTTALFGYLSASFLGTYGRGFYFDSTTLRCVSETNNNNAPISTTVDDFSWHIAVANFSSNGSFYLDGKLIGTGNLNSSWHYWLQLASASAHVSPPANAANANVDVSVAFQWDRLLTASEIKKISVDSLAPFRRKTKTIGHQPNKELRGLIKV